MSALRQKPALRSLEIHIPLSTRKQTQLGNWGMSKSAAFGLAQLAIGSARVEPLGTPLAPLFEAFCFKNCLGGRRGKECDQRCSSVGLTAAGNNTGSELGVVLNG